MATLPVPNPITNNIVVNYSYQVSTTPVNSGTISNTVAIQVNVADIISTKIADKSSVIAGATLAYTVTLANTGNVTGQHVVFIDTIPLGTTFVPNSLSINGASTITSPAPPGVLIPDISPNGIATITWQVSVVSIPSTNNISNSAVTTYTFTIDPSLSNRLASSNSNIVLTPVTLASKAIIDYTNGGGMVKSADKRYAGVGDVITYTIRLNNTGTDTANSVVFTDTIPMGTVFLPNTATVNGLTVPSNPSPPVGVTVGTIGIGATSTVTFQVAVNTIPSPNTVINNSTVRFIDTALGGGNSNQYTTTISQAYIRNSDGGLVKSVNTSTAQIGGTVTYTVAIKNTGNTAANNVTVLDTVPAGTTFVPNTVYINGVSYASFDPNIGFNIGNISPGILATITFDVNVVSIPPTNPTNNVAQVNYSYIVDPTLPQYSSTNSSNTVPLTIMNVQNVSLIKGVDKANAGVGSNLTYTVTLANSGTGSIQNIVFVDTTPLGTTFVANSLAINGTPSALSPHPPGVSIPDMYPSSLSTLTWQVLVVSIPSTASIQNSAVANYTYISTPGSPPQSAAISSNIVITALSKAVIDYTNGQGMVKWADKKYAALNDTITYTIRLKNTGTGTANSVVFTDTIPTGTTFVPNSVTLNGAGVFGANPAPPGGVAVGTIGIGATSTVTFQVVVSSTIPSPNRVINNSTVNFMDFAVGSGNSNPYTTTISQAIISNLDGGLVKSINYSYAKIGDTRTYTVSIKNTGNTTATNVVVQDTVPTGTAFVANTVYLNGVIQPGANPGTGINIGTVAPGNLTTLLFNVLVTSTPSPNPTNNVANIIYSYKVDPALPLITSVNTSNTVPLTINSTQLQTIKTVNKFSAKVGDTLIYSITLANSGNVSAQNIVFMDTIPYGTTFVANSLSINGVPSAASPAPPGVSVPDISPNGVASLVWNVVVVSIPSSNRVLNSAVTNYTFNVNPSSPPVSSSSNSNIVLTTLAQAVIDFTTGGGFIKTYSPKYVATGTTITYTIMVKNTGTVAAENVILIDTIPDGTTFIPNSVKINGVTQIGVSPAPPSGLNLGLINPNSMLTVMFQVLLTSVPPSNYIVNNASVDFLNGVSPFTLFSVMDGISAFQTGTGGGTSNTVTTPVSQASFGAAYGGLVKSVSDSYVQLGEVVTYTIVVKNTGNSTATNVVLQDTIPQGTTFVPNSFTIDGVTQPGANPQNGINLGSIVPGAQQTLTFNVTATTLPATNPTNNVANLAYAFIVDPSLPAQMAVSTSNTVPLEINMAMVNRFSKTVDKYYAGLGDTLTYTLTLGNTGNITATNVMVVDTIPTGTTFVPNSVAIDGVNQPGADPQAGINIGSVGPNRTVVVTFSVITI